MWFGASGGHLGESEQSDLWGLLRISAVAMQPDLQLAMHKAIQVPAVAEQTTSPKKT